MGSSEISAQRKISNTHTHTLFDPIYIKSTELTNKYKDKI